RASLGRHRDILRDYGLVGTARLHANLVDAWVRDRLGRRDHVVLDADGVRATRRSDTVFVFGSGCSLHDVGADGWRHIASHDTLGVSGFIHQRWIPVRYQLIRGWVETREGALGWRPYTEDFARTLAENPNFDETILVLQGEYFAQFANRLVGHGLVKPGRRMFRYGSIRGKGPPSERLEDGLRHAVGTLSDAVNFAYAMGWKRIVLTGVDLYDSRYFWLPPDSTFGIDPRTRRATAATENVRGHRFDSAHSTARNGVVELMAGWAAHMGRRRGVELLVHNPRSLLAGALPVYRPPGATLHEIPRRMP
ncbi:MAG: hypothetical protein ACT4PT_07080, partial [Methanobacteriota archaeon]